MKTFKFSKDSWHYKIVDHWEPRLTRHCDVDLCDYVQALFFACVLYGMICGLLILLAGANLYMIANTFSWLFLGYVLDPFTVVVGGSEICAGAFVGFIYWRAHRKVNEKEPGFISLAYRGWKEKFCARIEFE